MVKGAKITEGLLGFTWRDNFLLLPNDLNLIISNTSDLVFDPDMKKRVHKKLDTDIWMVEVDYRQIEKAFVNIFEHSVRAMHEGGDLYLETENVLFDEEPPGPIGTDEGRYVRFSMPESNVGIDEESCIRIFDPYYIFGEMDTGSKSGLAAVFGIIKNHEGSIEVSSDIGTGTTFNIYLPARQSEK